MESKGLKYCLIQLYMNIIFLIRITIIHLRWAIKRYKGGNKNTYGYLLGKTAIVTGGNSGLGFATSLMLASRGCRIIMATKEECKSERNKLIESTDNPNIINKVINLASFSSVRKFADDIEKTETKIDFLVNIAGVGVTETIISEDGLNNIMQINYLGHFLLTHLLIDQLKAAGSARVMFVGAKAAYYHKMETRDICQIPEKIQQTTGFQYFNYYSNAKLCVIIAAREMGKKLATYGITVNSIDPGIFYSDIVQAVFDNDTSDAIIFRWLFHFLLFAYGYDVSEAARNSMYVLTAKNIENGELYFRSRPTFKPDKVDNPEFCRSIWEHSESLVGLKSNEKLV